MFHKSPNNVTEFFEAVLSGGTGYVSIGHTRQKSIATCTYDFFPASDLGAIHNHLESLPNEAQVFFGLGRLGQVPGNGRGKAEDVVSFGAIAIDIDLHTADKSLQNLPQTLEEAIELVNSFTLRPSILVKSGMGLHAYWLLDQEFVISNKKERTEAKSFVANFHAGVNSFVAPVEFDHVQDISRMLRVPGFTNLKYEDQPLTVELISCDPALRYTHDEILSVSVSNGHSTKQFQLNTNQGQNATVNFDRIEVGCAWISDVMASHGNVGHNVWFATGSIMSLSANGRALFHQWSSGSPKYDFDETEVKFDQIDPDKARRTCTSLAALQNPELCAGCVFNGGITSPVELGEPGPRAIHVSGQQLPILTAELWAAIHTKNSPATVFSMNGSLVRVNEKRGITEVLDETSAKHVFARMGLWVHPSRDKEGWGSHAQPSTGIIKDALATPVPPVPPLQQVVLVPVLTEVGKILHSYGYDPETQIYYANDGTVAPKVNLDATQDDAREAIQWILDEVLFDFPFSSESSKAHALALAIQSFVRPAINGPTPFFVIDKPVAGTGATLLAKNLIYPYLGREISPKNWVSTEDELRKQITSHLLQGSNPCFFDNLEGVNIDSNVLAMALTSQGFSDRILQRSQQVDLVNRSTWVGTGNNPTFSKQLARRVVRIRLVSPLADPTKATNFKHENLDGWVKDHHKEYVERILTVICAWTNGAMPLFSGTPLASYVEWSQIVGGILEYAGVNGFLADGEEKADLIGISEDLSAAFIEEWYTTQGGRKLSPKEIAVVFENSDVASLWDSHNDQGRATKVGSYMRGIQERIYELNTEAGKVNVQVVCHNRKWMIREVKP